MLARVNETLAQSSKPLLVSHHRRDKKSPSQSSDGQHNPTENSENPADLASASHLRLVEESELPPPVPSVATAFLNLFGSIREKRTDLMRIFGSKNYQKSTTGLKKNTKFRKGTMLNEEAD